MICLCNPLNPTGKVFTKEELKSLGEIAIKHDLIILSDEIWSDIIFAPHVFTSIASIDEEIRKRTITITGFSKSYGLASLRVGAVFCPDASSYSKIFETSMHASTVHGCNVAGQIAATAALDECGEWLASFVAHLQEMRDLCVDRLNSINGISCIAPQGCYVAFANITATGKSSSEIHQLLMDEAKVAVVPGLKQWFGNGAEGYIRLSFATSGAILSEALTRIKNRLN
jgi:bifunctional pyridoxal-dependent enzyme with beta-cystathionase and maltose regulon repressor activities